METEDQICRRYEAEIAAISVLDRRYYLNNSAFLDERRNYAARQAQLEETRMRFYAELATFRQGKVNQFRRCRSVIRRSRPSPLPFS